MKIKYILVLALIIVSCKKSNNDSNENLEIEKSIVENVIKEKDFFNDFDDSKQIDELFNLDEYQKLSIDNEYKEYINDFWEINKDMNIELFKLNEIDADLSVSEKKMNTKSGKDPMADIEKAKTLAKMTGKAISSMFSVGKDAYGLIKLEKRKKELEDSFSNEKKKLAQKFEKQIIEILNYSCKFPMNENVSNKDELVNYKSIGDPIKDDKEVMGYLEPLIKEMDEFLILGIDLKTKIKLNKVYQTKFDSSQFTEYGNKILTSNGDFEVDLTSDFLSDYFKKLNKIKKMLIEPDFKIPVNDWSEIKQKNFNFIISDINIKLENEINSLK